MEFVCRMRRKESCLIRKKELYLLVIELLFVVGKVEGNDGVGSYFIFFKEMLIFLEKRKFCYGKLGRWSK